MRIIYNINLNKKMIVKNVSDYHNSHLKQAFQYHEQHPQHS
jgi:hypothetical protein